MNENNTKSGRSPWEIAAIIGLLATAFGPVLIMLLDRVFALPGLFFTLISLALAGFVFTRNRWLMAVVVVMSVVFFLAAIRSPIVEARLTNPTTLYFIPALLQALGFATAIVGSLGTFIWGDLARQPHSTNQS